MYNILLVLTVTVFLVTLIGIASEILFDSLGVSYNSVLLEFGTSLGLVGFYNTGNTTSHKLAELWLKYGELLFIAALHFFIQIGTRVLI